MSKLVSLGTTHSGCEEGSIIRFSVTSGGTSGDDWIERLKGYGFRVGDYAKQVLRGPDFKPTTGVKTEVMVLPGSLFKDDDRTTENIRAEAARRGLVTPNPELACLIREFLTDEKMKAMGFWFIVVMHEPINDSGGNPIFLAVHHDIGGCWLNAYHGRPNDFEWCRDGAFAFAGVRK